jgi:hypothetical protein
MFYVLNQFLTYLLTLPRRKEGGNFMKGTQVILSVTYHGQNRLESMY